VAKKTLDLEVDEKRREVRLGGRRVPLTGMEFELLRILVAERDRVHSRMDLLTHINSPHAKQRVVDQHVASIRRKTNAGIIETVIDHGYRLGGLP
jgi:DNA-binding response OmpR family regulator